MERKLYRLRKGKCITGVCGGIARYFGVDAKVVRLITVLLIAVYGSGLIVYILLTLFIPKEPKTW